MADNSVPLTREGKDRLTAELQTLYDERKQVAERIHQARELGTSQNDAEYDDAKQEQGRIEGRIRELEDYLHRSVVIDEEQAHQSRRVVLGSHVKVEQDGTARTYQIVGHPEASPAAGKISNESPVGRALLGKRVGDTVEVNVPRGVVKIVLKGIE
jgi:transcription elongation factor GreA